jgi:hypothetical protein
MYSLSILALGQSNRRQSAQTNTETLDGFKHHLGPVASGARAKELCEREMKGEDLVSKNEKV